MTGFSMNFGNTSTHLQLIPGKAGGFKKTYGDPWTDPKWSGEEKFDGHRELLHIGRDLDRAYLTGKSPTKDSNGLLSEKALNVPHIWKRAQEISKLQRIGYTVFDGEIIVKSPTLKGPGSSQVQAIMGTSPEKAVQRFNEGLVATFVIFDILFFNGEDVRSKPLDERRQIAREAAELLGLIDPSHPHFTNIALGSYVRMAEAHRKNLREICDAIMAAGGEGMILKRNDAPYGECWVKVKGEWTADVVVYGFTEAEATSVKKGETEATATKYAGQIGAVEFGVYDNGQLVRVGQMSGMDDDLRLDFTNNKEAYIGRAVQVKAQEFTGKALRHPRFDGFRDDILAADCTLEKLKRDMRWKDSEKDPE